MLGLYYDTNVTFNAVNVSDGFISTKNGQSARKVWLIDGDNGGFKNVIINLHKRRLKTTVIHPPLETLARDSPRRPVVWLSKAKYAYKSILYVKKETWGNDFIIVPVATHRLTPVSEWPWRQQLSAIQVKFIVSGRNYYYYYNILFVHKSVH